MIKFMYFHFKSFCVLTKTNDVVEQCGNIENKNKYADVRVINIQHSMIMSR